MSAGRALRPAAESGGRAGDPTWGGAVVVGRDHAEAEGLVADRRARGLDQTWAGTPGEAAVWLAGVRGAGGARDRPPPARAEAGEPGASPGAAGLARRLAAGRAPSQERGGGGEVPGAARARRCANRDGLLVVRGRGRHCAAARGASERGADYGDA